jgi:hypothetical protein
VGVLALSSDRLRDMTIQTSVRGRNKHPSGRGIRVISRHAGLVLIESGGGAGSLPWFNSFSV